MVIGIIGAMDVEVRKLKELMKEPKTETISTVDYCIGTVNGVKAIVAEAGVGKVNAAVCAQTMILRFNPDMIINIGVAGGLSPQLEIGDIAVAKRVVQHDMDTSPLGDEKGFITGLNTVFIDCDEKMTQIMSASAKKIDGVRTEEGIIASGDRFVADEAQKQRIKDEFGAIAVEMEGAAIGQVCAMANKPFAVLRAVSDGANSGSVADFPKFAAAAAQNSIKIVLDLLSVYAKTNA